jgi:hypothetical protein
LSSRLKLSRWEVLIESSLWWWLDRKECWWVKNWWDIWCRFPSFARWGQSALPGDTIQCKGQGKRGKSMRGKLLLGSIEWVSWILLSWCSISGLHPSIDLLVFRLYPVSYLWDLSQLAVYSWNQGSPHSLFAILLLFPSLFTIISASWRAPCSCHQTLFIIRPAFASLVTPTLQL